MQLELVGQRGEGEVRENEGLEQDNVVASRQREDRGARWDETKKALWLGKARAGAAGLGFQTPKRMARNDKK